MQAPPTLLLTTKLYRPRVDVNWPPRPTLLACLDAGLTHKLILLSAPPGFGKSTLVSQWLDNLGLGILDFGLNGAHDHPKSNIRHLKSCWLSLDEGDNQLVQFLRYLIAAVRTCEPAACPNTQSLLGAPQLPGVGYLADILVSELNTLPVELVLVLDDYHLIRSDEVHGVMRHLLRYRPEQLHLVILSRSDPPLHLGRLRIEQQITELRAGDLRFAVEETRQFLDRRLGQSLDNAALNLLHARTEGWITALQLSSIALQGQDPQQFLATFRGNDRLLVGYLVEEVMAHLAEPLRDFLLCTALVDRFCASLADALLADRQPPDSSQALIAQVEAQNLFIIPLDQTGDWFRYHDLFRDFLRHQLKRSASPATLRRLH
jgi:LuxR family maltose regulon positive regulatory protein